MCPEKDRIPPQLLRPGWGGQHAFAVIQPHTGRHVPAGQSPLQLRTLASEQPLPTWAPSITEDALAGRQQASPRGPSFPGWVEGTVRG